MNFESNKYIYILNAKKNRIQHIIKFSIQYTLLAKMVATGSDFLPSFQNCLKPKLIEEFAQNMNLIPFH